MSEPTASTTQAHASGPASDQLSRWFPPSRVAGDLDRVEAFWAGRGRVLVSFHASGHNYRQLKDRGQMAEIAVAHLQAQARLPGVNVPTLACDFGTVSTPRYWGGRVVHPEGGCIHIEPAAATVTQSLAIAPAAVDDPLHDAARAVGLFRDVQRRLGGGHHLWFRTPDMQGPLNTAALIVDQQELLMAMCSPDDTGVDALLHRIVDFITELRGFYDREIGPQIAGNIWPYTIFPARLGLSFTEDMMPLLSADTYRRFGIPILQELQSRFGGLHIHCCGRWGHHARNLADSGLDIRAVEFHHPYTTVDELAPLADRAVLIPYLAVEQQSEFATADSFYHYLVDHTPASNRYWFAFCDDIQAEDRHLRLSRAHRLLESQ